MNDRDDDVTKGEDGPEQPEHSDHYFALSPGTRLMEYEIVSVLGHGGFGITYLARDTLLDEQVAIKEYLPNDVAVRTTDASVRAKSVGDRPDFVTGLKTFLDEARLVARFRHPNIVKVRRFFEQHGTAYIVLDFESGGTLARHLSDRQPDETELRKWLDGILEGLDALHEQAALHRDLKPGNVMLRNDGTPVLIDFGAARDFRGRRSRSITAIATPGYSPPEQYGVGGQQGPWTDLYGLGAILYRAVTGHPPLDSLRRLRNDALEPAADIAKGRYTAKLLRAIDWMLRIDETERPASVTDLREALTSGRIPARTATANASSREARSIRPKWLWAATALIGIPLLGYGGYALKQWVDASAEEQAYLSAGEDLDRLRAYLDDCRICAFEVEAEAALTRLSGAEQVAEAGQGPGEATSQTGEELTAEEGEAAGGNTPDEQADGAGSGGQAQEAAEETEVSEALENERQGEVAVEAAEDTSPEEEPDADGHAEMPDAQDTALTPPADHAGTVADPVEAVSPTEEHATQEADLGEPGEHEASDGEVDTDETPQVAYTPVEEPVSPGEDPRQATDDAEPAEVGEGVEETPDELAESREEQDEAPPEEVTLNADTTPGGLTPSLDQAEATVADTQEEATPEAGAPFSIAPEANVEQVPISEEVGGSTTQLAENDARVDGDEADTEQDDNAALRERLAAFEEMSYQRAGEDQEQLQAYLENCTVCAFRAEAEDTIARLEAVAPETECDRLAADALDSQKIASVSGIHDMYTMDTARAVPACELAVQQYPDEPRLAYQLGWALDAADRFPEAMRYYQRAQAAGHAESLAYIGWLYQNGQGVEQDYDEAGRWFERALEQGSRHAPQAIGYRYDTGQGAPEDHAKAMDWYRRAADLGDPSAMNSVGRMYRMGQGVSKNYAEAINWYRRAADLGHSSAMSQIAVMYHEGQGTQRDYGEAALWYERAVRAGNATVRGALRSRRIGSVAFRTALQRGLRTAGVYNGPIDGDLGPGTQRALDAIFDTE